MLPLLIVGQIALHGAMAGQRLAAPLQALQAGYSAWAVGVLLALFAALPVLTAMGAGRMADRHGYHRPVRVAVAFTMAGAACALAACWLPGLAVDDGDDGAGAADSAPVADDRLPLAADRAPV